MSNTKLPALKDALDLLNQTQEVLGRFVANHRNPSEKDTISELLGLHDCAAGYAARKAVSETLALFASLPAPKAVQAGPTHTEVYAEGRGDQFKDDCAVIRLLLENCDDEDACGDGRMNTTRIRELLTHFDASTLYCSSCGGSGEQMHLSGGGPDAYDVLGPCNQCNGTGDAAPSPDGKAERTLLEQHDLDQSPEYRKGWEDGRLKGFEVGQRYAMEASKAEQAEAPSDWREEIQQAKDLGRVFSPESVERLIKAATQPTASNAGERETRAIQPPDFGGIPDICIGMSMPEVWDYACLVGYRTHLSEHDAQQVSGPDLSMYEGHYATADEVEIFDRDEVSDTKVRETLGHLIERVVGVTSACPGLTVPQLGEALAIIQQAAEQARAALASKPPAGEQKPVAVPSICDGKEQDEFETWAESERYDMSLHPLHWLFLNEKTYAARQGWKGALAYVGRVVAQPEQVAQDSGRKGGA